MIKSRFQEYPIFSAFGLQRGQKWEVYWAMTFFMAAVNIKIVLLSVFLMYLSFSEYFSVESNIQHTTMFLFVSVLLENTKMISLDISGISIVHIQSPKSKHSSLNRSPFLSNRKIQVSAKLNFLSVKLNLIEIFNF